MKNILLITLVMLAGCTTYNNPPATTSTTTVQHVAPATVSRTVTTSQY